MAKKLHSEYKDIRKPEYEITDADKAAYRHVEELVVGYQHRVPGVSETLIDTFEGYLVRYFQILSYGNINTKDYRSRDFISCFIGSPAKRATLYSPTAIATMQLTATSQFLKVQLSSYETEEIWNAIILSFLELADRHEVNLSAPCFHNFVVKMYHKILAKNVMDMTKDPLVYSTAIQFVDNVCIGEDGTETLLTEIVPDPENESEEVDEEAWIEGTQVIGFTQYLSPIERQVLYWRYIEEMNLRDIADYLGVQFGELQRMLKHITAKLKSLEILTNKGPVADEDLH